MPLPNLRIVHHVVNIIQGTYRFLVAALAFVALQPMTSTPNLDLCFLAFAIRSFLIVSGVKLRSFSA